jgi:hypothetical protein
LDSTKNDAFSSPDHLKSRSEIFLQGDDSAVMDLFSPEKPLQFPQKIVSGGQTGADRGALDAALNLGLSVGGWCPRGRRAEDGPIHSRYPLRETPSDDYAQRTEWNVRDSDATLILARAPLTGGTALTRDLAERLGKPWLILDPAATDSSDRLRDWLAAHRVEVLNIAGPRESQEPGIGEEVRRFLAAFFVAAKDAPRSQA